MHNQKFNYEDEGVLFAALKAGDRDAVAFVVEKNEKLVHSIAGKYAANERYSHDDLFQQGVIGLLSAVESFDAKKGVKFSSYAYKVIENAIRDYTYSNACQLSVSVNAGRNYLKSKNASDDSKEDPKNILSGYRFISLDDADSEDDATSFANVVQDSSPTPEDVVSRDILENELNTAIDKLQKDDAKIIRCVYGIKAPKMTLDEIANEYKVSKQAVSSKVRTIQKRLRVLLENLL